MKEVVRDAIQSLVDSHRLNVEYKDNGCEVHLSDGTGRLCIDEDDTEFVIHDEGWHEHMDGIADLTTVIAGLFDGSIKVAVMYRGKQAVGHQVQAHKQEEVRVLWQSKTLLSPFWRKKRRVVLSYKDGLKLKTDL